MRGLKMMAALAALAMGTAAIAQTPAAQPDPEKKICRKTLETGSLVKKKRQCFTRTEWARIAEAARTNLQYIQDNQMGRPAGGP